uniref:Uncharacterized protein n=1 Tax=Setaria digitata TaxID=48799 RepID=A0A915PZ44_9BILA
MQVKATLPTLELHSFGSESSFGSVDEIGAVMRSIPTPSKRSLIPRAAIPSNSSGILKKSHMIITYDK